MKYSTHSLFIYCLLRLLKTWRGILDASSLYEDNVIFRLQFPFWNILVFVLSVLAQRYQKQDILPKPSFRYNVANDNPACTIFDMEALEFPHAGSKPTKIHRDGKQGNFDLCCLTSPRYSSADNTCPAGYLILSVIWKWKASFVNSEKNMIKIVYIRY